VVPPGKSMGGGVVINMTVNGAVVPETQLGDYLVRAINQSTRNGGQRIAA
jgi:hypothetical protein